MVGKTRIAFLMLLFSSLVGQAGGVFGGKPAALPKLRVSESGRYFVKEDGTPFVWIGDTMWHLFAMTYEDMDQYIDKRRSQGFTILQIRLDVDFNGKNAYGIRPYHDGSKQSPNDAYWAYVDQFINKAEDRGLYVAPVLSWGETRKLGRLSEAQIYRAWKWVAQRYQDRNHIVWLTVGEGGRWRVPIAKVEKAIQGIRDGLRDGAGCKLVSVHPIWGNSTATRGLGSLVDFNNWQTSQWCHPRVLPIRDGGYQQDRDSKKAGSWTVWEAIAADYARVPTKPVIDAEAWYEGAGPVGDCEAIFRNGGARAYHVRRRAYFTVFAGACGHTYGAQGVWNKSVGDARQFRAALELPGARHVGHLGKLLRSQPVLTRIPDQSLIVSGQSDTYDSHVQATRAFDGSYAFVYVADGHEISVDLTKMAADKVAARWFSPRSGQYTSIGTRDTASAVSFDPPGKPGIDNDWVLVLEGGHLETY